MYESVFWSSCAASHDDWSISTVANYIMLKNTWCSSDFYAEILWDWNLRKTCQEGTTEILCFESVLPISKQFVELGCCVLLNIESEPFVWTAVVFLGKEALYPDYFLHPLPSLHYLTKGVLQFLLLPTVVLDHGKKLGQRGSLWTDETNWRQTGSDQNILLWLSTQKLSVSIQEYQTT